MTAEAIQAHKSAGIQIRAIGGERVIRTSMRSTSGREDRFSSGSE